MPSAAGLPGLQLSDRDNLSLQLYTAPNAGDAIGASLSYLLLAAERDPAQLRACLITQAEKPGFTFDRKRIIDVLADIASGRF